MADNDERMANYDIARVVELERAVAGFREWRAGIMIEHETLKQGVANFRSFQTRGNKFFDRFEAIADNDDKRRTRNLTIAGIFALLIVPLLVWAGSVILHTGMDIYRIEQQWKEAHPSEFKENKSLYEPPNQDYASHKVPQSADNSAAFTATTR